MEHRLNARSVMNATVSLESHGRTVLAKVRDFSLGGICVEFLHTAFSENTTLVVNLELGRGHDVRRVQIPAMVVHKNHLAAGIMFLDLSADAEEALRHAACAGVDAASAQPVPAVSAAGF